jgi:putative addiction module killer protein
VTELRGYIDDRGNKPFAKWFADLDTHSAARVAIALTRIELGNLSNVKGVGAGVFECRIDFGPGYRIYLGRDGDRLVILLGGGSKKRQSKDIATAKERWADYKRRKQREVN